MNNNSHDQKYYEILGITPDVSQDKAEEIFNEKINEIRIEKIAIYSLNQADENNKLDSYENSLKEAFEKILPKLKSNIEKSEPIREDSKSNEPLKNKTAIESKTLPIASGTQSKEISFFWSEKEFGSEINGSVLKLLREKNTLKLEELALITKINLRYISALENHFLEDIPKGPYLKGFLRSLFKCYKIPEHLLIVQNFESQEHLGDN